MFPFKPDSRAFHFAPSLLILCFYLCQVFCIREFSRSERDEEDTVVYSSERILRHGCRIAVTSSSRSPIENPPYALQSLKTTLEEVAKPVQRIESEETFDDLAERLMSEEHPVSRTRPA